MPLNWDDDDEEDLTEIDYKRRRGSRVLIHEEITSPMGNPEAKGNPSPSQVHAPLPQTQTIEERITAPRARTPVPNPSLLSFQPASMRDRFAAFFMDTLLGFYIYWIVAAVLMRVFAAPSVPILHQSSGRTAIHVGVTLAVVFFYYLFMESVFGATLGKFFCRLRVIEENGQNATLGNVFIRNFLRIVDYNPCFLIAVIAMESSNLHQRLGDRAGKTLVIKKTRRFLKPIDMVHTPLASTLSRLFAGALDGVMAFFLLYGALLMMKPSRPLLSFVMFVSLPFIFILYFTFLEFFTGSTPGKTLFKREVVLENGEPPDGTSALLRNLFRPLDFFLGYPLMVLSRHKQRLGDTAADTLVVAHSPGRKGLLGSLAAMLLVVAVAYFGFTNPDNFVRKEYGLGPWEGIKIFVPGLKPKGPVANPPNPQNPPGNQEKPVEQNTNKPGISRPVPASTSDKLKLVEFYFSAGSTPAQVRPDMIFKTGDLTFAFFKVEGFQVNAQGEASVNEDVLVEDSQGNEWLKKEKIVDITQHLDEKTPAILFANDLKMPKELIPGKYHALFTVKDLVAQTEMSFEKFFEVQ